MTDQRLPRVVLDTNCVLDLLHFADPRCAALDAALREGAWRAVSNPACRDEWQRVLTYPVLRLDASSQQALRQVYDQRWQLLDDPMPVVGAQPALPRCADPDDQKFLELAQFSGARLLISRDRELLRLSRRLQRQGLCAVITPQQFTG